MTAQEAVPTVSSIRLGQDVRFDAWLYSMMMDNNIAYRMNPNIIAGPEQLAFMVRLEDNQVYLPCSDATFFLLRDPAQSSALRSQYNRAWRIIMRLVRSLMPHGAERRRVLQFCRFRFRQYIAEHTLIPSRLVKRMTNLVLAQANLPDDPWRERRREAAQRQLALLQAPAIRENLEAMPEGDMPTRITAARHLLDFVEMARMLCLSAMSRPWLAAQPEAATVRDVMRDAVSQCVKVRKYFERSSPGASTILFLCDADGGVVLDLAVANQLVGMGHRVIYAVKSGFFFFSPTLEDVETDPSISAMLGRGLVLRDQRMSKNELLRCLREHHLVVISDGTRERLNLYRTSVTFSRAWKEADLVVAKGWRMADVLLGTSHKFTRDVICFWHDADGFHVRLRPHDPAAHKFSEKDIAAQAAAIIAVMREAHSQGRTVMFYSCIIGSIPGETRTAIALVTAFVDNLRKKMDNVLIINPAEHFIDGMDGDDLMYMWEKVQRSGQIDVWRFQTVEDIEESFALLQRKVPPQWSGKDSTFSTGCTKEMRIALDVQTRNREMQIIGPDAQRFLRRGEYGVGKYFDASIVGPSLR